MDPETNLAEQLDIANDIANCEADDCAECAHDATRLAELVIALDGWLSKGGFKPRSWAA